MKDTLKKMGLIGIGLISMTEEKITEFTNELIDKGELNREEGKKLVREIIEEKKKQKEDLEDKISSKVNEYIEKVNYAKSDEVKELKKRIEELEELVMKQSQ